MDLTVDGETKTYGPGDSYNIPAKALHMATLYPGFTAIDVFEDNDRYTTK